jgi:hypothetical protein
MSYKLFNSGYQAFVVDIEKNSYIPIDPANTDYQQYLAWLEAGNTPEPADIPPVIIPTLTMRQARLALLSAGLLDEVEAAITTPENRIWWDYSTTVERSHPLVNAVLTALGKTAAEIDSMFIAAATL